MAERGNVCAACGADWTWFVWRDDDEPPCHCDLKAEEAA